MDPQDSTPVNNEGANASPQNPAEQQTQSQPSNQQDQTPVTNDAPSQNTPENNAPQDDTQNQGQPPAGDSADDELAKWASSQNIDLDNPTPEQTKQLAQRLRDTQKWAHERSNNNQKFNEIQSQISDENEDPLEAEVRNLRNQNARRDFWDAHPSDRELESEMIATVADMVEEYQKTKDPLLKQGIEFYSTPRGWEQLLRVTKAEKAEALRDESYEAGRKTERANLAKTQQAAGPNAAATSSAPQPKLSDDEAIGKMTQTEYNEWRKSNNPFRP